MKYSLLSLDIFWKSSGQNIHGLFRHFLKHLASGLDLFDQPPDLIRETADVIVFLSLDEAWKLGKSAEEINA